MIQKLSSINCSYITIYLICQQAREKDPQVDGLHVVIAFYADSK